MDVLNIVFYGNALRIWMIALAVTFLIFAVFVLSRVFLRERIQRRVSKTRTDLDNFFVNLISSTQILFLLILSIYFGSLILNLPDRYSLILGILVRIALLLQLGLWLNSLINYMIARRMHQQMETEPAHATTIGALGVILRATVWAIVIVMVLNNIPGIRVDTLIASLGITGIAVGLAIQNILGDLFASLSIALDRPFVIGDFITVGDYSGTVEHIGLKSTRVRSLSGEQLVFGNNDLLSSRIRNFKRMARRRVPFIIGITYQTPYDKVKIIPNIINDVVGTQTQVTFDRAHFKGFGPSSLDFEVVYYVEDADYSLYMDIQQAINLEIMRRFEAEGIEFAYPTQTVFIENSNAKPKNVKV